MNPQLLLTIIKLATAAITGVTDLMAKGQVVMSRTEAAEIKDALAASQAATAAMRPRVDAALDAAAKR